MNEINNKKYKTEISKIFTTILIKYNEKNKY